MVTTPTEKATRPRSPKVDLPTKRRRKHGRVNKPRRDNRKSRYDANYTAEDERVNPALEAYYRAQRIVPESEFSTLFSTFRVPLPSSFRITAATSFREDIEAALRGEMAQLFLNVQSTPTPTSSVPNPDPIAPLKPPAQLPWYPGGLAWTVSAPRQMLRRDNVLAPFHRYLVRMHELGAINRQEAVSMVPPLMLDPQPGHAVIDLCAAPGSKTAQILEMVSSRGRPLSEPGLVIANDADIKRCWMLAHQLSRFSAAELVLTHHEAQYFPKFMAFDRVLCDVPCTGDGTLRKAPDIWRRWNSNMGIGIHRLQKQILERGLDILKPGGRIVYSTCSMNPLENEAVVAHALRKYGDEIELVDSSNLLPGLIRRKGLTTWKVKNNSENASKANPVNDTSQKKPDETAENGTTPATVNDSNESSKEISQGESKVNSAEIKIDETKPAMASTESDDSAWFESFEHVPLRRRKKIVSSLFPPSEEELGSGKFPLHLCMRFLPHDQDTGAFFVTVIQKKTGAKLNRKLQRIAEKNEENKDETVENDEDKKEENSETKDTASPSEATAAPVKANKKVQRGTRNGSRLITDDPLVPVSRVSPKALSNISAFYGVPANISETCFLTRGSDVSTFRRIVAVSRSVRTVLRHALGSKENDDIPESLKTLRVVNAGVRVMERTDRNHSHCGFRLLHVGAHLLTPILSTRVVREVDPLAAAYLLGIGTYRIDNSQDDLIKAEGDEEKVKEAKAAMQHLWTRISDYAGGSVLAVIGKGSEVMVVWVGKTCVNTVMSQDVVQSLREQLEKTLKIKIRIERQKIDEKKEESTAQETMKEE